MKREISYAEGILEAFNYLLTNHQNVFVIGQGLWSPWYVGASMKDLDVKYGKERVIDSPVSELAVTGAAVGASICGYRPVVVHPRMDFMVLAIDQIVNQAAKWRHMFGGKSIAPVTIRGIINRGGEQGAQHSQALHSWFAHVPGLRVVMPATADDARDLLVASVLSDDPVMFIDDRWCYEHKSQVVDIEPVRLDSVEPRVLKEGNDVTILGIGYSSLLCLEASTNLEKDGISAEVIDLRILNPIKVKNILKSVEKTKRFVVVDGGWTNCGMAGELIARVMENISISDLSASPKRVTLTDAPAPTSSNLEEDYYTKSVDIEQVVKTMF